MDTVAPPERLRLAQEVVHYLTLWQSCRISAACCARNCRCTFSEWQRIWPKVGRYTPREVVVRLVRRVILRGMGGDL